jgi:tripartite-type tricarboxylate transporter receptor subunit TctC
MNISRRRWIGSLAALPLSRMMPAAAQAARQPLETGRLLCGYPPGGSIDVLCRALAGAMTGRYARTVLVDNKPGAAGRLVVSDLTRAAADGATLLVTPASVLTMYPFVYKQLSYDPLVDLVPVSMLASFGFVLVVGPRVPAAVQDVTGFVTWCKANPKAADCGNAGSGSLPHFLAMLLAQDTGVELTHVPYKGTSAAMQDLAGAQLSAVLATEASAMALIQAGRVRALATSWEARSPFLPMVPSFAEQGLPRLSQREWFGAFLPKGAPMTTVDLAGMELSAAIATADVRETLQKTALHPEGSKPKALQSALHAEHDFWRSAIKASGFTPET